MIEPLKPLLDALAAFAADPMDEGKRRAVGVARVQCSGLDPEATRWPGLTSLALLAAHAIMDQPAASPRSLALSQVAGTIAAAEAGDLSPIRVPSAPPAPIRQYKDD